MCWPTQDEPSLFVNIGNFLIPFVCVLPFFNLHAPLWVAVLSAWGIFRVRSAPTPRQKSAARSLLWSCALLGLLMLAVFLYLRVGRFP